MNKSRRYFIIQFRIIKNINKNLQIFVWSFPHMSRLMRKILIALYETCLQKQRENNLEFPYIPYDEAINKILGKLLDYVLDMALQEMGYCNVWKMVWR